MPPRTDAVGGPFAFFFYGTLCDAEVREVVIGRKVEALPATLEGYAAVPVARGRYPILLAEPGGRAQGVVCGGISLEEAARLGFYEHEGRDYGARLLTVREAAGAPSRAWVFMPSATQQRGPGRWDLTEWQRFAKRSFLDGVRRAFLRMDVETLAPYRALWSKREGGG